MCVKEWNSFFLQFLNESVGQRGGKAEEVEKDRRWKDSEQNCKEKNKIKKKNSSRPAQSTSEKIKPG